MTADVLTLPVPEQDTGGLLRSPDVCTAAGCTYRMLDHWVRCGHIRPARAANGSGTQRLFTVDEVNVIRRMAALVDAGLLPAAAIKVARADGDVWLTPHILITVI